ncbi:MAG: ribokinase [Flavobacteriaceae bacterium]|nr:ribokinase [Flavobacteriaceae bacterium]
MDHQNITVIGSSNTDMVLQTEHLPAPGETLIGGQFEMKAGGKGANQAVAAAKLGGQVTFIAKVGDDPFGQQAISDLSRHGIDTSYITTDPNAPSGVALIMVDAKGENSIGVALGANDRLFESDLEPALNRIKSSAFVLMQLESPMALIEHFARLRNDLGFRFVLNPAPAKPLSKTVLEALFLITPNAIEAESLTGIKVSDSASASKAAHHLREAGVANVIITMGGQGAFVCTSDWEGLIPCPKVKVVDTTAAGDTFNGALMVALAEGKSMQDAVVFANAAAAFAVGILGAQNSAPTRNDLVMTD